MKARPLACALCLTLLLTACAKPLKVQIEPLPANLRQPCLELPLPPVPLIDAARALWETEIIRLYGTCAARHLATVKATKD